MVETAAMPELIASVLTRYGVAHGFAPSGAEVAAGFHLVRTKQVHGSTCLVVGAGTASPASEADALLTAARGTAVAIATADCVPILLAADDGSAVGAVHAGWRGTLAGVTGDALGVLRARFALPPDRLRAAIGPAIDGCCFEIERRIAAQFAERFGGAVWDAWRDGRPGKGTLDLRRVNELILRDAGVPPNAIERVGPCTFCGGGPYASYRRQGPNAGRQLSWIGLTPETARP
jgi:YfiH family protein